MSVLVSGYPWRNVLHAIGRALSIRSAHAVSGAPAFRVMRAASCALLLLIGGGTSLAHAQARSPVIQQRVQLDAQQPVGFHVIMVPDTVFVGQQATYEMGVFISESAQQRMRRNPEVVPAELRGVLAYDLGGPQSLPALTLDGQRFFPHVLQRALFPLANGVVSVPSSQLSYSLPRTASYFSREEAAVVRADEVTLVVKPLPLEGQPSAFSGAVGVITLNASVDANTAQVGEPVVLTVRLGGRGNVKLWPRPNVASGRATVVEAGERIRVDSSGQYVRGTKEFDWLLTPDSPGSFEIPVVEYPYFDPYDEAYRVASTDPIVLAVSAGEVVRDPVTEQERAALAIRRTDRGALSAPLAQQPVWWILAALLPLPAIWRRRQLRRSARAAHGGHDPDGAPHVRTSQSSATLIGDPTRLAATQLRKQLLTELAQRLDATQTMVGERRELQRRLRRRGVTREVTREVMTLLAELDEAAWSASGVAPADRVAGSASWTDRLRTLRERVNSEAIPSRFAPAAAGATRTTSGLRNPLRARNKSGPLVALLVVSAFTLGAATASAAQPTFTNAAATAPAAQPAFSDAVAAYDQGEFARAASAFRALAALSPRHADAWANAGTAAWAASDTANAVLAWQRALRLEPNALDLRTRLAALGGNALSGVASVPTLSPNIVFVAAVALWCVAWALLAFAPRQPGMSASPLHIVGMLLVVLSAGAGLCQYSLQQKLNGESLAVMNQREAIRVAPGAEANAIGDAVVGDVLSRGDARLDAMRGERWFAVQHADGREGWLPERVLRSLR